MDAYWQARAAHWNGGILRMMRFLVDTSPRQMAERFDRPIVVGQLQTPLTRYQNWGGVWAADNGAFSGFNRDRWFAFLKSKEPHIDKCLWITLPDIVGNARRTLEAFWLVSKDVCRWPWALVAQDGLENFDVPWISFQCLFIGGSTDWKDSRAAADLVRTAKILGKQVHIGRVNSVERYIHFNDLGADTCDGTGIVKYDHMLANIETHIATGEQPRPLLDSLELREASK